MAKAQCLYCGDVIESRFSHDFKYCQCGRLFIDGGNQYLRLGGWEYGCMERHARIIEDCDGNVVNEPIARLME